MAVFTFVFTGLDGHQHSATAEAPDARSAIETARAHLTPEHRSVAVGEGAGEAVMFLGAWDCGAGGQVWTPEE